MWHGGQPTDMLVTVQDMLRLVKVARLELTKAGRSTRARLTVQRLTDTGVRLRCIQCGRQVGHVAQATTHAQLVAYTCHAGGDLFDLELLVEL